MSNDYEKPYVRVTMSLPRHLVKRVDELGKRLIRTRSGMASWLMQKQLGMIGDAEVPQDIEEADND